MINSIVFDLGAVLIDWNPEYLYREILPDEEERSYFLREICNHDWNIQQDAGRSWKDAIEELTAKYPHYSQEIESYWHQWPRMLGGPITGTVQILEELAGHYPYRLLALTNWSAETWPHALERFDFLHKFEGILVSGQEKMKKPDPAIYERLISRYQLIPQSTLFIDDNPGNVQAAKASGMEAVQFTTPEDLRAYLFRLGVMRP